MQTSTITSSTPRIDVIRDLLDTIKLVSGHPLTEIVVSDLIPPSVKAVGPVYGRLYIAREEWDALVEETDKLQRHPAIVPGGDLSTIFLGIPVRGL